MKQTNDQAVLYRSECHTIGDQSRSKMGVFGFCRDVSKYLAEEGTWYSGMIPVAISI